MRARQCMHYLVSGRVQGVFYRASARATAQRLGLSGWVRNTAQGKVELIACGDAAALHEFETWLWQGPAQAQVTAVVKSVAVPADFSGFDIQD